MVSATPPYLMAVALAGLTCCGLSLSAASVRADEAIPTGANAPQGGAPIPAQAPPIRLPTSEPVDDDSPRPVGPCGGVAKADGRPDRGPHGEVFAGVGTRGYREVGGVVCTPLGDRGAVIIAVDAAKIDARRGRR